jgi:pimeloyl-ACP methyl ester carboxylesterase
VGRRKGARHLVFDLVDDTSRLVEDSQRAVWDRSIRWIGQLPELRESGEALRDLAGLQSAVVHAGIRGVSRGARSGLDVVEAERDAADEAGAPDRPASPTLDDLQATINGGWGSHLARRGNGLDVGFTLRDETGRVLPAEADALADRLAAPTRRVAIFVHGLGSTERCWRFRARASNDGPTTTYGTRLRDDLGYTPLYVRYNTGRRVVDNGRALAHLVSALVDAYPIAIEELALVGHSMGGLVARAAALVAEAEALPWWKLLRHVVTLGSPHTGAPLARSADALVKVSRSIDDEALRVIGAIVDARSDGVHDLSTGYGAESEAAPVATGGSAGHVQFYFVGGTMAPASLGAVSAWLGDLVVSADSAAGKRPGGDDALGFQGGVVLSGLNHLQLPNHPRVYDVLRRRLEEPSV